MTPGALVRWRGLASNQYGVVLSVARAGTVTVRKAGSGNAVHLAGDRIEFKKRLRSGYERSLRVLTAFERDGLIADGWLRICAGPLGHVFPGGAVVGTPCACGAFVTLCERGMVPAP